MEYVIGVEKIQQRKLTKRGGSHLEKNFDSKFQILLYTILFGVISYQNAFSGLIILTYNDRKSERVKKG